MKGRRWRRWRRQQQQQQQQQQQRTPLSDGQCTVRGSRQSGGCRRAAAVVIPLLALRRPPSSASGHSPPPRAHCTPSPRWFVVQHACSLARPLYLAPSCRSLFPSFAVTTTFVVPFPAIPSPPRTRHRRTADLDLFLRGREGASGWFRRVAVKTRNWTCLT